MSSLLTYVITAFVFLACGVAFVTRDVLALIAPPIFGHAYSIIFLVIPALAFRIVYYVGESLLFIEKRTDVVGTIVTTFTLLSVALNYLFIARWGMYGAAAVFVITTVGTGATVMKLGLRMAPVHIEKDRLLVAALLLFGFLQVIYAFRTMNIYVYYTVVPGAICAATALLYASNFVREDERRVIESFIGRIPRLRSALDV
jgi:O-antigen/teichoic acid export membrane protein